MLNSDESKQAMDDEYHSLTSKGTCDLFSLLSHSKLVKANWVLLLTTKVDGPYH